MLKFLGGLISLEFLILVVATQKTEERNNSIYFKFHQSDYDLKFEWAEIIRFTKPELKHFTGSVFKYNRTCPAVNITWTLNIDLGYELEAIGQVYKFASNEYRLFPIRLQINVCRSIKNDLMGLGQYSKCGNFTGCPVRKGTQNICNWSPDQSQFPPFIPSGKYMMEMQGLYRNKELWVLRVYGEVSRAVWKN